MCNIAQKERFTDQMKFTQFLDDGESPVIEQPNNLQTVILLIVGVICIVAIVIGGLML